MLRAVRVNPPGSDKVERRSWRAGPARCTEGDLAADAGPPEVATLLPAVLRDIEFLAKTDMDASALVQIGRSALSNLLRR
ncbi:hypothetical protein ACFVTC_29920 [Streptomyces sp. NPDC057950]|uniref:hypothetical protein n=1 Tax=Streptomyces sp. NPDC057950 TaxID=3346288 RepID=UPI0036E95FE3